MGMKVKEIKKLNLQFESGIEMKTTSEGCCLDAFPIGVLEAIKDRVEEAIELSKKKAPKKKKFTNLK